MIRRAAVLFAMFLVAGCTETGHEDAASPPATAPASPTACTGGQARFGKTRSTDVLVAVSPVMNITSRRGGPLTDALEPVGALRSSVHAEPGVPLETVYQQLAEQRLADATLIGHGAAPRLAGENEKITVDGPGEFVRYQYVAQLEVGFTWTCGPAESSGTVTTWVNGTRTGIIDCGDRDPRDDAISRKARALRC